MDKKIAFLPGTNVHVVPENLSKCAYSNGSLLLNGNTMSLKSDLYFIGQIVNDTLHLTRVQSMSTSAYCEKQERQSEFMYERNFITEESESEVDEPQEILIQQSMKRNATQPTVTQNVKWNQLEITRKDVLSDLLAPMDSELKIDSEINELPAKTSQDLLETMQYTKITTFELLKQEFTQEMLLEQLPSIAVLVNGAWIVRSELLYSEPMRHVRNVLLWLFSKQKTVKRSDLMKIIELDAEQTFNLFGEIAFKTSDWSLKCSDSQFCKTHKKLAKEQQSIIDSLYKAAQSYLA